MPTFFFIIFFLETAVFLNRLIKDRSGLYEFFLTLHCALSFYFILLIFNIELKQSF